MNPSNVILLSVLDGAGYGYVMLRFRFMAIYVRRFESSIL